MNNLKNYLFTSESVSEGHPDKVCDRISDMVVDSYLSRDPFSRVACETLTTTNRVVLAGETRGPKIEKDEIINIHLNTNYFVYMVGFIPGHPFMGDLDSRLFLNRLKTPRVKIPAGSVGIVEKFCNIYPYESPGGWNIIGRTPTKLFNKKDESNPCLLSPGDSVKFKLISKKEFEKLNNGQ